MFIEMTKNAWRKFKSFLDEKNYIYEAQDATLEKDSVPHIRVDIAVSSRKEALLLGRQIDIAYGLITEEHEALEKEKILSEPELVMG